MKLAVPLSITITFPVIGKGTPLYVNVFYTWKIQLHRFGNHRKSKECNTLTLTVALKFEINPHLNVQECITPC